MIEKQTVSSCLLCLKTIYFQECPTGGWWVHMDHPEDNHEAYAGYDIEEQMDDYGNWYVVGN